jgi:hypothetical protein
MPDTPTTTPTPSSNLCVSRIRGGANIVVGEHKFGLASAQFDGNSTVEIDDHEELSFGSDDFCVELWIKKVSHTNCHLISQGDSSDPSDVSFSIRLEADGTVLGLVGISNTLEWLRSDILKIVDTSTWHHIALGRVDEQHLFLMVDGQIVDSKPYYLQPTELINNSASPLHIGGLYDEETTSYLEGFIGYIDEVRISKHGRYSITNSQGQAPASSSVCDSYTSLLMHMTATQPFLNEGFYNDCAYCPPETVTPTPYIPLTTTCTTFPQIHLTQNASNVVDPHTPTSTATPTTLYPLHVTHPIPDVFRVGALINISENTAYAEQKVIYHIDIENAIFYLSSQLVNSHPLGSSITTECCTIYKGFEFGLSFPDNVKNALEIAELEIDGPAGPTGPIGPTGPMGGINQEATLVDTLDGVGSTTYVSPSIWYQASNQYVPLIWNENLSTSSFIPNAQDYAIFDVTYEGACSLSAPVNWRNGRTITFLLRRSSGGSLTLANEYLFDGGYEQLTDTDGAVDALVATNINGFYFCTIANDIKRL